MSVRYSASINSMLTNYAQGLAQDMQSALAEFLAPTVEVGSTIGKFKKFNEKQDFQLYDTSRAIGGTATRIQFSAVDGDYNCKPQSLEVTVDDAERDAASDEHPSRIDEMKVRALVSAAALAREIRVIDAIKAALTPAVGYGDWSNANSDPIAELDLFIEEITKTTGRMPNRMAMGIHAWKTFRNHPNVIKRQPGAQVVEITFSQAAQMLLNPNIELRVGLLSHDMMKFGAPKVAENILGSEVFIFYANATPDLYDPSFAKTFMGRRGSVMSVRTYRDERSRSDIHAIDWSEDIQIVTSDSARRLAIT